MSWLTHRRGDLLAIGVLAAMTLVMFWRFIFTPYDAIHGDAAYLYQPYYEMAAQEVRAGRVPLWNPYILMGVPFHASLQPALFYPLRWPMFFMDYVPGFVFTLCLHYFLGAVAAYIMIRACLKAGPLAATLGAMAIIFGGFAQGHMSHPNYFLSYPWFFGAVTCLWLGMQRSQWRWALGAGACIGLMGLAGSVHLLLVMGVLLGTMAMYYTVAAIVQRLRHSAGVSASQSRSVADIALPLASLLTAIVLGGAIAAVQLLPAQKLSQQSVRQDPGSNEAALQARFSYITTGSANPGRTLLQMAVPFRYGDMRLGYWAEVSHDEMAHYTSIAMLLFAAVGLVTLRRDRDRWLLVVLAAVGFLVGAGKFLPFYQLVYDLVPPFRQLRFPTRIWWCMDIAIACLGALGIQRMQEGLATGKEQSRSRWLVAALAAVVTLAMVVTLVQLGSLARNPQGAREEVLANPEILPPERDVWTRERIAGAQQAAKNIFEGDAPIWAGVAVAMASLALVTVIVLRRRPMGRALALAVGGLVAADLLCLSFGMVQFAQQYYLTRGVPPRAEFLQKNLGLQRYACFIADPRPTRDDQIQPNRGMQFGIRFLQGTGGGIVDSPVRTQFISLATNPLPPSPHEPPAMQWRLARVFSDLAGVKYFFVEPELKDFVKGIHSTWAMGQMFPITTMFVPKDDRYEIVPNPTALPPAWFVDRLVQASGPNALRAMYDPQFDPNIMAVLAETPPATAAASSGAKKVTDISTVPGHWTLATEGAAGQLVVSEGFAPGWVANIDGQAAKVYQTNDQMMSVAVPAGKHQVELSYAPPEFRTGLIVSLAALLLTLGAAVALRFVPAPASGPVDPVPSDRPRKKAGRQRS